MEFVGFPKIPRYSRECIITEKIDGTNAQVLIEVAAEDDPQAVATVLRGDIVYQIYAGSRNRWLTVKNDNHGFARWVNENAEDLMKLGVGRHFGEWWGQGIQRGYGLKEKRFSLFNVHRWGDDAVRPKCCYVVPVLYRGPFDTMTIHITLASLAFNGSVAAPGFMQPEGIIIYHVDGNLMFKKTIEGDESPRGCRSERNTRKKNPQVDLHRR